MKELTIEQKAKAYDEAIEKAIALYKAAEPMSGCNVIIKTLFPKFKEIEDERIRTFLHHTFTAQYLCEDKLDKWHGEPVVNILAWLEKRCEQKFAEWSEEDEKYMQSIVEDLEFEKKRDGTQFGAKVMDEHIEWLKSLKNRFTWKPSDAQMELLDSICASNYLTTTNTRVLQELYDALKKLKE